ncbi:hypothetical protein HN748_03515 [Candidatus Peregrinibacteria bacterium]|jgi:hypothetical protein|nr:hypothetical protein [Candidatus Peregrinibacteria bacterium]MBT7703277.1 hypothetical protein [Candidatus Peregrinibacteria bacterium]
MFKNHRLVYQNSAPGEGYSGSNELEGTGLEPLDLSPEEMRAKLGQLASWAGLEDVRYSVADVEDKADGRMSYVDGEWNGDRFMITYSDENRVVDVYNVKAGEEFRFSLFDEYDPKMTFEELMYAAEDYFDAHPPEETIDKQHRMPPVATAEEIVLWDQERSSQDKLKTLRDSVDLENM